MFVNIAPEQKFIRNLRVLSMLEADTLLQRVEEAKQNLKAAQG